MENQSFITRKIAFAAVIAAAYAVVTLLTASFAYGPIQFRLAEALAVLCCFEPMAAAGVTLGCLIANLFSPISALDIVVGTFATLIAALIMTHCRKAWTAVLPNVIANGVLVGAMLAWVLAPEAFWQSFLLFGAEVAAGELAVMLVLGVPLFLYLKRSNFVEKTLRKKKSD